MKCTNCGSELPAHARFCDTCGMQLVTSAAPEPSRSGGAEAADTKPLPFIRPREEGALEDDMALHASLPNPAEASPADIAEQSAQFAAGRFSHKADAHDNEPAPPFPNMNPRAPLRSRKPRTPVMSLGQAVGFVLLSLIPGVNLIVLCIWAFGGYRNPSRQNMARAVLIVFIVFLALLAVAVLTAVLLMSYYGYTIPRVYPYWQFPG